MQDFFYHGVAFSTWGYIIFWDKPLRNYKLNNPEIVSNNVDAKNYFPRKRLHNSVFVNCKRQLRAEKGLNIKILN